MMLSVDIRTPGSIILPCGPRFVQAVALGIDTWIDKLPVKLNYR